MKRGLLLLSGGRGSRMGTPKHGLAHPAGGSWGSHLVRTFSEVFPDGAIVVLGEALPDQPELLRVADPCLGPAKALQTWAQARIAGQVPAADRWWIVACDQVRWSPGRLRAWASTCDQVAPAGDRWVIAEHAGYPQPLGGWCPDALCARIVQEETNSIMGLVKALPYLLLPREGDEWRDVDTPEERTRFEAGD